MEPERRQSGLLVPRTRSLPPPPDPQSLPPRSDMSPNANDPVGTVGPAPTADNAGFGAQNVMYPAWNPPLEAAAWAGWPAQWATPNTYSLAGRVNSELDVVWGAIDLNARIVADFPTYASKGGVPTASPSWLYNPQPEVYSSWSEFMKTAWWSYQAAGEVFVLATSRFADTNYPRTFMMLNPMFVGVDIVEGKRRFYVNGIDATDDMCHIRYSSWPGDDGHGHGPLEVAGYRVLAAHTLMKYATDLAMNGGVPWAVLKHKYRLGETQANELKLQWIQSARNRSGAPAILDQDMDLQVLQVPPKDMALAELQAFAEARISILLGVPPYLLSLPSGADSLTYSNVSSIFDGHWRISLKPGSRFIMTALSGWALPAGTEVEVNPSAYVQPTPTERATFYKTMVEIGAMTVEEVRQAERLAPTPTGPTGITDAGKAFDNAGA